MSPQFKFAQCSYPVDHGQVRCGIEGFRYRADDNFLFQDLPYPYCPQVRPASGGLNPLADVADENFILPAVGRLRTPFFRDWVENRRAPDWSPADPVGRMVMPSGEFVGYSFLRQARDMIAPFFPFADGDGRFPAPGSRGTEQVGPDGCGAYPDDWTFVAPLVGYPSFARTLTGDPLGLWATYMQFLWDRRMADTGPFICRLDILDGAENVPRGRHFDPSRYDIGSVVLERGLSVATVRVHVLTRTCDGLPDSHGGNCGSVEEDVGAIEGVYYPNGDLYRPGSNFQSVPPLLVREVELQAWPGISEPEWIIRVADSQGKSTTDYRVRLHTY